MCCLYILQSQRTGKYYVGTSDDVPRRLKQHNGELPGLGRWTVAGRPWELVFQVQFASRAEAIAAEKYVKGMKSRVWIARLASGEYTLPPF
jgi:predicted GIY-YIG superfamily endonuclease